MTNNRVSITMAKTVIILKKSKKSKEKKGEKEIRISKHALERAKDRLNLTEEQARELIEGIVKYGEKIHDSGDGNILKGLPQKNVYCWVFVGAECLHVTTVLNQMPISIYYERQRQNL